MSRKPIRINVWYDENTKLGRGYYWDTSEDSGGYDRCSPQGPFKTPGAAEHDAARLFERQLIVSDGKPDHYSTSLDD